MASARSLYKLLLVVLINARKAELLSHCSRAWHPKLWRLTRFAEPAPDWLAGFTRRHRSSKTCNECQMLRRLAVHITPGYSPRVRDKPPCSRQVLSHRQWALVTSLFDRAIGHCGGLSKSDKDKTQQHKHLRTLPSVAEQRSRTISIHGYTEEKREERSQEAVENRENANASEGIRECLSEVPRGGKDHAQMNTLVFFFPSVAFLAFARS